jgi:putative transposase
MKLGTNTQNRRDFEMAQYQITVNSELLHHLFQKNTKDSGMAQLLESIVNQILQAQATQALEAHYYERTDTWKGYRNGTYPYTLVTRVGSLTVKVPRLRNGDFSTDLFARFETK